MSQYGRKGKGGHGGLSRVNSPQCLTALQPRCFHPRGRMETRRLCKTVRHRGPFLRLNSPWPPFPFLSLSRFCCVEAGGGRAWTALGIACPPIGRSKEKEKKGGGKSSTCRIQAGSEGRTLWRGPRFLCGISDQ